MSETSLQALIELSKEIHTADDLYKVAEVGLLNFMGLLGSSTRGVILKNVRVPAANLLHEVGMGHQVALNVQHTLQAIQSGPN